MFRKSFQIAFPIAEDQLKYITDTLRLSNSTKINMKTESNKLKY